MTITIELKPTIKARLQKAASLSGMDEPNFVQHFLDERLPLEAKEPHVDAQEAALLEKINSGVPEAAWRRYRKLSGKLLAEQRSPSGETFLVPGEYEELLELTHQVEAANVERIKHLIALAILRQVTLPEVMKQLGITTPEPE